MYPGCANHATRKARAVKRRLPRHPRCHLRLTPASASWITLVERWFAELAKRTLRCSAHRSGTGPEAGIRRWTGE